MHIFEVSGLGKAPFSLSKPDETNECFFVSIVARA